MSTLAASAAIAAKIASVAPATSAVAVGVDWSALAPDLAKGIPTALVALLVSVVAARIAWAQKEIAQGKLNLDLFDKRLEVFEAVWAAMTQGTRGDVGLATASALQDTYARTRFLFGAEMGKYVVDVVHRCVRLSELQLSHADALYPSPESLAKALERDQITDWFIDEVQHGVHRRFDPFMDFERWRSVRGTKKR